MTHHQELPNFIIKTKQQTNPIFLLSKYTLISFYLSSLFLDPTPAERQNLEKKITLVTIALRGRSDECK